MDFAITSAQTGYWGSCSSMNINDRGEELLECILGSYMNVAEKANDPTYVISNIQEVLDITLVSHDIFGRLPKRHASNIIIC